MRFSVAFHKLSILRVPLLCDCKKLIKLGVALFDIRVRGDDEELVHVLFGDLEQWAITKFVRRFIASDLINK